MFTRTIGIPPLVRPYCVIGSLETSMIHTWWRLFEVSTLLAMFLTKYHLCATSFYETTELLVPSDRKKTPLHRFVSRRLGGPMHANICWQ